MLPQVECSQVERSFNMICHFECPFICEAKVYIIIISVNAADSHVTFQVKITNNTQTNNNKNYMRHCDIVTLKQMCLD